MPRSALLPLTALVGTALAGCTGGSQSSPSLLPRAAETQGFEEPTPAPAPTATADAALDARIAALAAEAAAAERDFIAADRRAAAALAAGRRARIGSDAWLDAQTALAALDEQRATLLAALSGLEQLAIVRAAEGQPPYPALESARSDADAALDRVTATVTARKADLPAQ